MNHRHSVEIVALVGSNREESYNRGLLRTAMLLAPDDVRIVEAPINTLPFFNPDLVGSTTLPAVRDFREALRRADAVLLLTPEYAYSVPGMLKNALDWASVPRGRSVLRGKPIGMAGASIDRTGTLRAQMILRSICSSLGGVVIPEPEVYISFAEDKFNTLGELADQTARGLVTQLIHNLADWAALLREPR